MVTQGSPGMPQWDSSWRLAKASCLLATAADLCPDGSGVSTPVCAHTVLGCTRVLMCTRFCVHVYVCARVGGSLCALLSSLADQGPCALWCRLPGPSQALVPNSGLILNSLPWGTGGGSPAPAPAPCRQDTGFSRPHKEPALVGTEGSAAGGRPRREPHLLQPGHRSATSLPRRGELNTLQAPPAPRSCSGCCPGVLFWG